MKTLISVSKNKLILATDIETYQLLKLPELWVYRQDSLKIYLLQGESYQESEQSRLFPDIDIKNILPDYVELGWTQGASVALRQFQALKNLEVEIK